jgi:Capsule polysaccharide biosynthesis protein
MHGGTLVAYTPPGPFLRDAVRRLAVSLNLELKWFSCRVPFSRLADDAKRCSFAVIWNGLQRETALLSHLCSRRSIPRLYIEHGLLPQRDSWLVDPAGFCGGSMLNQPLHWVNEQDRTRLLSVRSHLQETYPLEPMDERVLVPLQLSNDSQILFHSPYRTMQEFAEEVLARFRGRRVVFRPHPRARARVDLPGGGVVEPSRIPFLDAARRSSLVVSITSTCLYEAAALGVPVEAWGDHPFRRHKGQDHDTVAAAILALRLPRRGARLETVVARFGLLPARKSSEITREECVMAGDSHGAVTDIAASQLVER